PFARLSPDFLPDFPDFCPAFIFSRLRQTFARPLPILPDFRQTFARPSRGLRQDLRQTSPDF
ncbi:hypothetical protein L9F63_025281, partial [Diploptera punctata]